MSDAARARELLAQEATQPEQWYYLSFAGEEGFRGATIVRARGTVTAVRETHVHGINPGGEVLAVPINPDESYVPKALQYKLVTTRAEIENLFADKGGIASPDEYLK